jgi:hypothetical protein
MFQARQPNIINSWQEAWRSKLMGLTQSPIGNAIARLLLLTGMQQKL